MNVKVVKQGKEWAVEFGFDVQTFYILNLSTKRDAEWMAKMLRKCFKKYAQSLVCYNKQMKGPEDIE